MLTTGSRHSDLQLRNDLLVITTLIAENPKSLLIVSTETRIACWKHPAACIRRLAVCNVPLQLAENCVFQESLFAKQLVVLATFPEREARLPFKHSAL